MNKTDAKTETITIKINSTIRDPNDINVIKTSWEQTLLITVHPEVLSLFRMCGGALYVEDGIIITFDTFGESNGEYILNKSTWDKIRKTGDDLLVSQLNNPTFTPTGEYKLAAIVAAARLLWHRINGSLFISDKQDKSQPRLLDKDGMPLDLVLTLLQHLDLDINLDIDLDLASIKQTLRTFTYENSVPVDLLQRIVDGHEDAIKESSRLHEHHSQLLDSVQVVQHLYEKITSGNPSRCDKAVVAVVDELRHSIKSRRLWGSFGNSMKLMSDKELNDFKEMISSELERRNSEVTYDDRIEQAIRYVVEGGFVDMSSAMKYLSDDTLNQYLEELEDVESIYDLVSGAGDELKRKVPSELTPYADISC